jgi:hypothetical protein
VIRVVMWLLLLVHGGCLQNMTEVDMISILTVVWLCYVMQSVKICSTRYQGIILAR